MSETDHQRVTAIASLGALHRHSDVLTAAATRLAHLVAWNQPLYPAYLWWLVGGDWQVGFWTFLSTPFFAAAPLVARRHALAGRAMVPVTGAANGLLSAKLFGAASAVELFLIPCALIALLGFRRREWRVALGVWALIAAVALAHGHYGAPVGRFDAAQYARLRRLNLYSVVALSLVIVWSLGSARRRLKDPIRGAARRSG